MLLAGSTRQHAHECFTMLLLRMTAIFAMFLYLKQVIQQFCPSLKARFKADSRHVYHFLTGLSILLVPNTFHVCLIDCAARTPFWQRLFYMQLYLLCLSLVHSNNTIYIYVPCSNNFLIHTYSASKLFFVTPSLSPFPLALFEKEKS